MKAVNDYTLDELLNTLHGRSMYVRGFAWSTLIRSIHNIENFLGKDEDDAPTRMSLTVHRVVPRYEYYIRLDAELTSFFDYEYHVFISTSPILTEADFNRQVNGEESNES